MLNFLSQDVAWISNPQSPAALVYLPSSTWPHPWVRGGEVAVGRDPESTGFLQTVATPGANSWIASLSQDAPKVPTGEQALRVGT